MESRLIHIEYETEDNRNNLGISMLSLRDDDLKTISFSTSCGARVSFTREEVVNALTYWQRSSEFRPKESQKTDPWVHRSAGMRCKTCMWYVSKTLGIGKIAPIGRCRRHAPSMNGYPVCYEDDWCGDHKVDENKV